MIKVAIIEDDLLVCESLLYYLKSENDFDFVEGYGSVQDFLDNTIVPPSVLLVDIELPGMSGIEGVFYIKQKFPDSEILMFTVYEDKDRVFRALQAGATGYLLKNTPLPRLKSAIKDVLSGNVPMSPSIARMVIAFFSHKQKRGNPIHLEVLTPRENELALLLIDGLTYKQVAYNFHISPDTVRQHIKNIYRKLHINCRTELIKEFHRSLD